MRVGAVLPLGVSLGWAAASDWATWAATGRLADHGQGDGLRTVHADRLAAIAAAGITDVRLPVDWARLQPRPGRLEASALAWYDEVLRSAERAGLRVWAALFEGPAPGWFTDERGFADEATAGRAWPRWIELVAEALGDRVAGWMPLDDPVGWVAAAYLDATAPPGRHDPERHALALERLLVAWRDAWRILRGGPPVATWLRLSHVRPADHTIPARQAARRRERLQWGVWLDALRDGRVDVPGRPARDLPDLAGSCDVLGATFPLDVTALHDGRMGDDAGEELRRWTERTGGLVRRLVEEGPSRPLAIGAPLDWPDADEQASAAATLRAVADEAAADRIGVDSVWVTPTVGVVIDDDGSARPAARRLAGAPGEPA